MMKIQLDDTISSSQDLTAVILELRRCSQWLAQNTIKMHVTNNATAERPPMSAATATLIQEWGDGKPLDQKGLDGLIAALESLETHSKRITITLAAPPTKDLRKLLLAWCRKNIDPNILVDVHFNSTILGGLVVQYGSHIYDWSFRRQILTARSHFPEVLRRV